MCQAIVLAAGYSSRAKTNKLALPFRGMSILANLVITLLHVCEKVVVVTGHYDSDIREMLYGYEGVEIVFNERYPFGMFGSVKAGLSAITSDFFVIPGDYPLLKKETCERLLTYEDLVVVPVYNKRRGHPILFKKSMLEALKSEPIDSNLKAFRNKYSVRYVGVDDPGVVIDVDTMDDYKRIVSKGGKLG